MAASDFQVCYVQVFSPEHQTTIHFITLAIFRSDVVQLIRQIPSTPESLRDCQYGGCSPKASRADTILLMLAEDVWRRLYRSISSEIYRGLWVIRMDSHQVFPITTSLIISKPQQNILRIYFGGYTIEPQVVSHRSFFNIPPNLRDYYYYSTQKTHEAGSHEVLSPHSSRRYIIQEMWFQICSVNQRLIEDIIIRGYLLSPYTLAPLWLLRVTPAFSSVNWTEVTRHHSRIFA